MSCVVPERKETPMSCVVPIEDQDVDERCDIREVQDTDAAVCDRPRSWITVFDGTAWCQT